MIDKLTYDQVLSISKELSKEAQIIDKLAKDKNKFTRFTRFLINC